MSSNAIAVRTESGISFQGGQITEVQRLGNLLAASGYFSDAREIAAILGCAVGIFGCIQELMR